MGCTMPHQADPHSDALEHDAGAKTGRHAAHHLASAGAHAMQEAAARSDLRRTAAQQYMLCGGPGPPP